jgi:hypothetical protein
MPIKRKQMKINKKLIKNFCGCFTCFTVQGKKKEVEKMRRQMTDDGRQMTEDR